ncbi:GLPGLI family protein [Weeksellaceae bacterium KMM 9713]|uniref:GLPGLI family protein n=1 Tax=Profundicola chukchiensis TaxID=2961959 RepID=A0A9X4RXA4_9FLAO|nr:GLPGLI family protein [Profundicola chukchiensis]MDG4945989.1 GLPGLI family protein [Profundicola chukchiensis]MDG4951153.1 GLPGLI family protein [Profundicola chukchiensis]
MRVLTFICLILCTGLFAQDALKIKYGKQTKYDISQKIIETNKDLAEALRKAMQDITDYELVVYNNEAQFVFVEKIKNDQTEMSEGSSIIVTFGMPDEKVYSNYNTGITFRSFTANGKYTLIKSELPTYEWELTRETKEILGIKVRKAIIKSENKEETAWYAPQITYKAGPEDVWGLPGLILEYQVDRKTSKGIRTTHIFAQEIEQLDANLVNIEKPDESKAISPEQYKEETEAYMKKLKEMYSQGVDTSD